MTSIKFTVVENMKSKSIWKLYKGLKLKRMTLNISALKVGDERGHCVAKGREETNLVGA